MKTLKQLTCILLTTVSFFLTACGGDEPNEPNEPDEPNNPNNPNKEIPTDEVSKADFVGVWKLESSDPFYWILETNLTGAIIVINEDEDSLERVQTPITWRFFNQTLYVGNESFKVIQITSQSMILIDNEGYKETLSRIKESEIPGDSTDDGSEQEPDHDYSSDIKTLTADPSAFKAILTAKYSGGKMPQKLGFQYSYDKTFPEKFTEVIEMDGKFGGFSLEAKGLVDLTKVYYRAFATVNDKTVVGETKSFETLQGTYKIDGVEYKFIKVIGLETGSYSMMQTEVPPNATIEIEGKKMVLNSNTKDPVTKGETREFFNNDVVLLRYPTPQEWMFAASGGKQSAGFTYSGGNNIDEVAWYSQNSNGHARSVAKKKANELGFYDMSGNYAELCAVYDEDIMTGWKNLSKQFITGIRNVSALYFNTMWSATGGAFGGSWKSEASKCLPNSSENVTNMTNSNKYNNSIYTIRCVYSRPD